MDKELRAMMGNVTDEEFNDLISDAKENIGKVMAAVESYNKLTKELSQISSMGLINIEVLVSQKIEKCKSIIREFARLKGFEQETLTWTLEEGDAITFDDVLEFTKRYIGEDV